MLRYYANLKAIRYESTSLKRIVADKSHRVIVALAWAVRAVLQYSGKIEIQKRPALFRNPQSFIDCSMERSIRYNFFD